MHQNRSSGCVSPSPPSRRKTRGGSSKISSCRRVHMCGFYYVFMRCTHVYFMGIFLNANV
ncbi:hypothetical protein HanHA300_Chr11g0419671 [Helianthus annuus]|nr:hypothetical protein HanHA300_Chr11g0419671 [Helianthus annuus]KAJ0518996.1 hypothetical protein HanHA89_Chr11g0443681 [Helianthus annuus]KAJ0686996.1 hypothetical protein HanLR1_Chr11g0420971 [Helianthus annuus]